MKKTLLSNQNNVNSVINTHTHTHTQQIWLNRKLPLIVVLMLSIFSTDILKAQFMTGFPSTPTASKNGVWYTDENRAAATDYTLTSGVVTLDITPVSGSSFSTNDRILLIVMDGGIVPGIFAEFELTGATSTTISFNNNATFIDFFGGGSILTGGPYSLPGKWQAIKIPRFGALTLQNCEVTCHPYDETTGTGGVICFSAENVILDKAIINARGKGFAPSFYNDMNFRIGGVGGAGDNIFTNAGGGMPSVYETFCLVPDPGANGYDGQAGSGGQNGGSAGSGAISDAYTSFNYGLPNRSANIAKMGVPGFIDNANVGGNGGGGGGHGGDGGVSGHPGLPPANPGSSGDPGEIGGNGGKAGRGARGGGIILIKTRYFDGTSDQNKMSHWLDASGEDGGNGYNGIIGGRYGNGGKGGVGDVVGLDVYFSGANGGNGHPGEPSDGGDASDGGGPGTIFLYTNPSSLGKSSSFEGISKGLTDIVAVENGDIGRGGQGAFQYLDAVSGTEAPDGVDGIDYNFCPLPTPPDSSVRCDCDMAMYPFRNHYINLTESPTDLDDYYTWNDENYSGWSSYYFANTGTLRTVEKIGTFENIYYCRFNDLEDATTVFKALVGDPQIESPIIKTRYEEFIDLSKTTDHYGTFNSVPYFEYHFEAENVPNVAVMKYVSFDNTYPKYIEFTLAQSPYNFIRVDTSHCASFLPRGNSSNLVTGNTGKDGNPPEIAPEFEDHFSIDDNTNLIVPNKKDDIVIMNTHEDGVYQVKINPNTNYTLDDVRANSTDNSKAVITYQVVDINGRIVKDKKTINQNSLIDLRNLSSGVYLLQITYYNLNTTHKIIVP